jgi:6-phosphofructokinase 1
VNLLVLQGGGPTPVVNASLFGVVDEARAAGEFERVFGARFGFEGLIRNDVLDFATVSDDDLQRLKNSPGASLGSTRHKLSDADIAIILDRLEALDVGALIIIGGNGTLRGADLIHRAAGDKLRVIGVPKTVDNDIPGTDRCPGFASAARHAAQSVRDLGMDVRTLPQPVSIFETMGRNAGWLAGATVLAKLDADHAPHLIYLPETLFEAEKFLADIDRVVTRLGWAVVVVNEGIRTTSGAPVYECDSATQRDALGRGMPGGVAVRLADVVTRELKIRCRWEKPGLTGRASVLHVARQDMIDAEAVSRAGVRAAMAGHRGVMVALMPLGAPPPTDLVPLADHAGGERAIPRDWFEARSDTSVTQPFVDYVKPIVGDLIEYAIPFV